jgi:hypothetical protein
MIIAITTNDNKNVGEFSSSKILLVDTETDKREETNFLNGVKYADILVTSHLDGFDAEEIVKNGVNPIKFLGSIEEAIENFKDCGLKRTLPIGENGSCGGSCGI